MTVKEKLQFFADNGMSITFIAKQMGSTLQNITNSFVKAMEE